MKVEKRVIRIPVVCTVSVRETSKGVPDAEIIRVLCDRIREALPSHGTVERWLDLGGKKRNRLALITDTEIPPYGCEVKDAANN